MNFKERFLRGDCPIDSVQDWTEFWYSGIPDGQTLQGFLGLSDEEYKVWLTDGEQALAKSLSRISEPRYIAIHLDWEELGRRLEDMIRQRLGLLCEISIERFDYYYWEMRLDISADVDEELSAKIHRLLRLKEIEPDYFMDNDCVDCGHMLYLLGQMLGREVSFSLADDNGVWFYCKEYRASSQDIAAGLIAKCEKRLRREIRSKQYPLTNQDTAVHQLLGFKEALKQLGLIPEEPWSVELDHFSDCESIRDSMKNTPADK